MPRAVNSNLQRRFWWQISIALALALLASLLNASSSPLCLYVSSYNQGETWSDGVERGLRDALGHRCEIASFYMDTHRYRQIEEMQQAGLAAYELARDLQPDVIITSDDNAAKYLILPYLVDTSTPVVFAGINWTVREYGLPASNVTGMVEVAPLKSMLSNTLNTVSHSLEERTFTQYKMRDEARILFLSSNTLSERKMLFRLNSLASRSFGSNVDSILVDDFKNWLAGFKVAQRYDLVIIGNNTGIRDWDDNVAELHVRSHTKTLSVTFNTWMMRYSVLGFTRVAEEQGEWAGLSAVALLDGLSVSDIPVVTNRRVETWVNPKLLSNSGLQLNPRLINSARKYY
ncbi:ABC transporter substrate-binding protein [Granulosicoccus antarcticus]|uniref:ABC transporter substrate-binding protein PnrA-like domain-containing protein n=1 Tax=Granulosicoccus antarcticus IMCC3135 TaxID=1192854 RepID=A0A2Z2P082_9GAMM|nr:hypothetical protein [Granulosicoccus antarcticus]ASJ75468.1 hypothetical protein IMCC3135_27065 [Granulosicoccus antarcticus IMCC3135]